MSYRGATYAAPRRSFIARLSRHIRLAAKFWAIAVVGVITVAAPGLAGAQTVLNDPPPITSYTDANGVDLTTGNVITAHTDVSIGQGLGAMVYSRTFFGSGWRDNITGTIAASESAGTVTLTVSVGPNSEEFTVSGSSFNSVQHIGSTLVFNTSTDIFTYTQRDGTVYLFNSGLISASPNLDNIAPLISVTTPNGVVTTYTWETAYLCASGGGSCETYGRLQSINNNLGYQLKLSYSLNGPTNSSQVTAWQTLTKVMGINNAVDYCNPSADTCSGFTTSWPSATYNAVSSMVQTVTDSLGRVWTYTWNAEGLSNIQSPLGVTSTYTYNNYREVQTFSNGIATWNYAYNHGASTLTTTSTDPSSHTRTVVTDEDTGLVESNTDGLGNTTNYIYDSVGRLTEIKLPEGNYTQYTLDARGNAYQTAYVPKSGSGLATVTTYAGYDSTCTYPAKCNQPNSVTDGNGNVTNYTYDNTYGVPLTVTPPAPTSGAVQPQTRYSYTSLYAHYNVSGSGIVNAASPVYLLTKKSTCQTESASTCPGTADEVVTTTAYGSTTSTVANNLGQTAVTIAAGDGSLSATTSATYDSFGNVQTTQGPLGSAYTTMYRYDADREVIGVVAPNPGTAGLHYPAVRTTYNADGLVTLKEQGTVNSQSDSDWAAFATLLQTATDYDTYDRQIYVIAANSSGAERSVVQYSYDSASRLQCVATRMNSALFGNLTSSPLGSLPTSACALGTKGGYGNDRINQISYDGDNRPNKLISAYGSTAQATTVTTTYTNNGLTKTLLDAMSNLTTVTYDGFDRRSQINYPSATQSAGTSSTTDYEAYAYDANSNILSDRRRDGTSLNYCYDALNRMIRKDFPGSTSTNCALTSLSGSVFSGYDLLNRLTYAYYNSTSGTGVAYTYDALSRTTTEAEVAGTLSYQYDLAGDLTQLTWPDGFYAGYAYDNLARVITINENGATSGLGVLGQYSYNDLGQITGAAYGNGASTSQTFDGYYRLNTLTQSFTGSSVTFTYAYNPAGQIVSKSASDSSYVSHPGATSVSYTATGVNRYATVGGVTYSYDGRQNLTSDGTRTFTYDSENKLLTGSAPTSATYTYDPLGRLQTQATGSTITYLNAGSMMVGEYGVSGITVRPIPIPGANAWVTFYNGSGTSSPTWVAADELGSIINFSNSSGAGVSATGYGNFGEPATWTSSTAFTGQMAMTASQIYNYRARMYDPRLGRFLQTDPAGYGGGDMNLYGYVLNDPINLLDPFGLADPPTDVPGVDVNDPCPRGTEYIIHGAPEYEGDPGPVIACVGPAGALPVVSQVAIGGGLQLHNNLKKTLCAASQTLAQWSNDDTATSRKALIVAGVSFLAGPETAPVTGGALAVATVFGGASALEHGLAGIGAGIATGNWNYLGFQAATAGGAHAALGGPSFGGQGGEVASEIGKSAGDAVTDFLGDKVAPNPCGP